MVFQSNASNLLPGDTNSTWDIFVLDRQEGHLTLASVATSGTQGNGGSYDAAISADGWAVAFQSDATNLVAGDTNGVRDVLVRDRQTGQTTRVSVSDEGAQTNGASGAGVLSSDGRFVAFESTATNLVAGDTNGVKDVFVHDRQTGQTTRVSVADGGTQGNKISTLPALGSDGRFVVFDSVATNLVAGDTNGFEDVFVRDRQTSQTTRVSVASDGTQGNHASQSASISSNGRFVVFASYASNLIPGDTNGTWDVFLRDRSTGQTTRVSVAGGGGQGNGYSYTPSISPTGRFVAFLSTSTNFAGSDTNDVDDVFLHDRQTGETTRVSVASDGTEADNLSFPLYAVVSSDGRFVAFDSYASNLVPGDTNGIWDVFLHDRSTGQTTRVSSAGDGTVGNGMSWAPRGLY